MKTQFKRHERFVYSRKGGWSNESHMVYRHCFGHHHRWFRTFNEVRQNYHHDLDGHPVRRRRLCIPTIYDDLNRSRDWGRCWKDFTKQRKQWGD